MSRNQLRRRIGSPLRWPFTPILLGVLIRVALAHAADGTADSDNAVVALMAMHALEGKFYPFFWGQHYMGSLESLVIAPFFALFGVSEFTLSLGLLPWYVLTATALYGLTGLIGGRLAGAMAVSLHAVAPPVVLFYEVTARGGYPETLAFGTWMLWLSLRIAYGSCRGRAVRWHYFAIGLVGGLAFWTNWLVFPYVAVAGFVLLLADPRLPWRPVAWGALGCFLIGSLPLWAYNLREGFPTFAFAGETLSPSQRWEALVYAVRVGIPQLVGVRDPAGAWMGGWPGTVVGIALAGAGITAMLGLARSWWELLRGRLRDVHPAVFLFLLVGVSVSMYCTGLPGRFRASRYLLPVVSATIPLMALGVAWIWRRRRPVTAVTVLGGLIVLYGLQAEHLRLRLDTFGPRLTEDLAAHLQERGVRFGYAEYNDSAITTFLTREEVILANYHLGRYPVHQVDFHDPALVLRPGKPPAETTLECLDAEFRQERVSWYRVYWPIRYDGIRRAPLGRDGWSVTASPRATTARRVLDGDNRTYWSVPFEVSSPRIEIDLGEEQTVNGIFLHLGDRSYDVFRELEVLVRRSESDWTQLRRVRWDFPLSFDRSGEITTRGRAFQTVFFPPTRARGIRLVLREGNRRFNWSIGELALFGPGAGAPLLEYPEFSDVREP